FGCLGSPLGAAFAGFFLSSAITFSVLPPAAAPAGAGDAPHARRLVLVLSEHFARRPRDPLARLAVLAAAQADARALVRLRVPQRDLRDVERGFLLEDAALLAGPAGLRVALDEVHLLDGDGPFLLVDRQHLADARLAGLTLRVAGQHHDRVTLADVEGLLRR